MPAGDDVGVVVIGASAGGLEALIDLFHAVDGRPTPPIVVVLHVAAGASRGIEEILSRQTDAAVATAHNGAILEPSTIHVAPAEHHVLVDGATLRLSDGPRINGHRPSIDTTMHSAAESFGRHAAGMVLTGMLDDGAAGLAGIAAAHGRAAVQAPETARHSSMPDAAIRAVPDAEVLDIRGLAGWLTALAGRAEPAGHAHRFPPPMPGGARPTRFVCPDCGGVLFEDTSQEPTRFQCSVGHAFSPESLLVRQGEELEAALWDAVRSLEDRAALLAQLAAQARARGTTRPAERWDDDARRLRRRAAQIRAAAGLSQPRAGASDRS